MQVQEFALQHFRFLGHDLSSEESSARYALLLLRSLQRSIRANEPALGPSRRAGKSSGSHRCPVGNFAYTYLLCVCVYVYICIYESTYVCMYVCGYLCVDRIAHTL